MNIKVQGKRKVYLYSALYAVPHSQGAQAWITQCYGLGVIAGSSVTCNYITACLYFVIVHQMAPLQTEVADVYLLQPTSRLSIPKGRKAESAWLADLQRTVKLGQLDKLGCAGTISSDLE